MYIIIPIILYRSLTINYFYGIILIDNKSNCIVKRLTAKQAKNRGKNVQKGEERKSTRIGIENAVIILFCALAALLDFVDISYVDDAFRNRMISKIIQQTCGSVAGVLLLLRLKVKLFQKPQQLLYLIPCMIVAIDNFQFSSYFNEKMELVRTGALSNANASLGFCTTQINE